MSSVCCTPSLNVSYATKHDDGVSGALEQFQTNDLIAATILQVTAAPGPTTEHNAPPAFSLNFT